MYTNNDYKVIFNRPTDVKKIIAIVNNDRCYVEEFFHKLQKRNFIKLYKIMDTMAMNGSIKSTEQFKYLENKIFEFKSGLERVFCFYFNNMIVCTHGIKKPKGKGYRKEISKAIELRNYFINL